MNQPTLEEINTWPATVSITRCASALGCSKSALYELVKQGKAPVRMLRLGTGRTVAVTSSLVALLSETGGPTPSAPASALVAA
ncbi:helix-turn-helix transcriptional regulator [Streptomyces sp. NPDC102274]|uniref:helix-turn-helix transcriptional regulator n=1 Tax=Streptomyces sp. NPDC102274 TaxID=3366151 RepID=UPI00381574E0